MGAEVQMYSYAPASRIIYFPANLSGFNHPSTTLQWTINNTILQEFVTEYSGYTMVPLVMAMYYQVELTEIAVDGETLDVDCYYVSVCVCVFSIAQHSAHFTAPL